MIQFLKKGTGGRATPNIFLQEEEPATKEGIWLQASGLSYDKIIADTSINAKETWEDENCATLPIPFYSGVAALVGTDIYFISGGYYPGYNYKYDTITNTFTKMKNLSLSGSYGEGGGCVAIGTDIFIFKSGITSSERKLALKYDTLNDTYTALTDTPINMGSGSGSVTAIGTDIYLLSETSLYKYDTLTDTYTQLKTVPYNATYGGIIAVGTDIFICGSATDTANKYMYKYDTLNDKYTRLSDIPVAFSQGSLVLYGSDIYMFVNTNAYKYNVITDTYEQIADIPYNFYRGNAVRLNSEIYLIGGFNSRTSMRKLNTETKEYANNSILLLANNTGYATQLVPSSIEGRVTTKIVDAWHYTVADGLNEDLPTYYGNGTEWIKFKN